jgi:hypothetical protein
MFGFNFFGRGIMPQPDRAKQIIKANDKLENFKNKAFEHDRMAGHTLMEADGEIPRRLIADNAEIFIRRLEEIELDLRINAYPEREDALNVEFDRLFQEVNEIGERPCVWHPLNRDLAVHPEPRGWLDRMLTPGPRYERRDDEVITETALEGAREAAEEAERQRIEDEEREAAEEVERQRIEDEEREAAEREIEQQELALHVNQTTGNVMPFEPVVVDVYNYDPGFIQDRIEVPFAQPIGVVAYPLGVVAYPLGGVACNQ